MSGKRTNWIDVDLDGLRKLLNRRGKEFAIYELAQNVFDENATFCNITLTVPHRGVSELIVEDDSPEGFRDLTHAYTMYAESYKKSNPEKRGAFNLGEKFVLALCSEVTITSTTGRVTFNESGRNRSNHPSHRREKGTEFRGVLRLTAEEFEQINEKVKLLLPEITTIYNGVEIPKRQVLARFNATLPTVFADEEGVMRPRKRNALVQVYRPLPGETPMVFEMGIPVVETGDTWHVSVEQKVPLNMERDNVTPGFLAAVRVAVLNHMSSEITPELASETWVRAAAGDSRVEPAAFKEVVRARFGDNAVSYDPSDIGSNREASSKDYTVVTGGSMSAGEWENARRTGALTPAGQVFPTSHNCKVPDKVYDRSEWTPAMARYFLFVVYASHELLGYEVEVRFIRDPKIVCGQFFGTWFNVNLAHHNVENQVANIELMLHELAHTVVQSNDHLNHQFYETVGTLGAKLALLAARDANCFQQYALQLQEV